MFETILYYGSIALAIYKALAVVVTVLSVLGIAYVAIKSMEMRHMPRNAVHTDAAIWQPLQKSGSIEGVPVRLQALRDSTIMRWHEIVERLAKQQEPKDYKSAVIEADGLVDVVLRAEGYPGETMGDRMRTVSREQLPHIDDLWKAHKVRNDIAHDPHYIVSPREGHDTILIYKQVLEELGAL